MATYPTEVWSKFEKLLPKKRLDFKTTNLNENCVFSKTQKMMYLIAKTVIRKVDKVS